MPYSYHHYPKTFMNWTAELMQAHAGKGLDRHATFNFHLPHDIRESNWMPVLGLIQKFQRFSTKLCAPHQH